MANGVLKKVGAGLGAVALSALLWTGQANAVSTDLTNSSVSTLDVFSLFSGGGSMTETFDFAPFATGGDGTVTSGWLSGITFTPADGLYLYYYEITVSSTSSDVVHGISLWFPYLYSSLDINNDSVADSSWYCSDCSGNTPTSYPFLEDMNTLNPGDDSLTFLFLGSRALDPGDYSTFFGAISTMPPMVTTANLIDNGGEASPDVYAPVPEPSTLLLLGSGLVGFGGFGYWMRRKRA
jgi:hypothetical protein